MAPATGVKGTSSCLAATLAFLLGLVTVVTGCGINIRNQCTYPVTTCAQSANDPIYQYQLKAGSSQYLDFGSSCRWPAGGIWASVKGQCVAPGGSSNAANDRNLANLAEFTIGSGSNDFYDLSNVNAYTIPMQITPTSIAGGASPGGMTCGSPRCTISDIPSFCKGRNMLITHSTGAYSCINVDGPVANGPTSNTQMFKNACPSCYSYSKDSPTSLFTCPTGSNYDVVFCPKVQMSAEY